MTDAARIDDEIGLTLVRVAQAVDRLTNHRDRLATALRDIIEYADDRADAYQRAPLADWTEVAKMARTALGETA